MAIYYSDKVSKVYRPSANKSTSRYDTKLRVSLKEGSTKIRFIRKNDLLFSDKSSSVHVVDAIEAFRPDILANEYFGDEKYAWVILAANNLKTPYELVRGMKIVIPSLVSLQGADGKLVTR